MLPAPAPPVPVSRPPACRARLAPAPRLLLPLAVLLALLTCMLPWAVPAASAGSGPGEAAASSSYTLFYDDPTAAMTLADILAVPERFRPLGRGERPGAAAAHWLRVPLANPRAVPVSLILTLGVPDVETLKAYQVSGAGILPVASLAADAPYGARPVAERMVALPVSLAAGEQAEMVLRYHTHVNTPLALELLPPERFHRRMAAENLLNGMIFGLLTALAMVSLLHYRAVRQPALLVYGLMALLMMGFVAQLEGYFFAYLWPELAAWNQRAPIVLAFAVQVAHTLFTMTVFDMRRSPGLRRAYLAYLGFLGLGTAIHQATGAAWPGMAAGFAYGPLAITAGIVFLRRGPRVAGYFLAATVAYVLFNNILFGLCVFGYVDGANPFAFPRIGCVTEAVFLALALARQTLELRRQVEEGWRLRVAEAEQLARAEAEKSQALLEARQRELQLAATSHDLSQPLSSIRFALAALRLQGANEAATRHIGQALDHTEGLLRAVIDEAKRNHADRHDTLLLDDILENACHRHQAAAEAKGLTLRHHVTAYRVEGSETILARILDNFIGNAVRYTARGGILVGARLRPRGIEVQVLDTGPGFDLRHRAKLLAPFAQSGRLADERRGHGLGLHIVHTLCAHSGYVLTIRSTLGRGSAFGVLLPSPGQEDPAVHGKAR